MTPDEPAAPPTLRIVRGEPTPDEIAVILALLAAAGAGGGDAARTARSSWAGRAPTSWRRSTLPG